MPVRKAAGMCFQSGYISVLLFSTDFKIIFSHSAKRANPIFGKVFKCGACGNSCFRITFCRVINITAYSANVLFHACNYYVSEINYMQRKYFLLK